MRRSRFLKLVLFANKDRFVFNCLFCVTYNSGSCARRVLEDVIFFTILLDNSKNNTDKIECDITAVIKPHGSEFGKGTNPAIHFEIVKLNIEIIVPYIKLF